jgi:type II secretory pathway pseudopilin PulG
MRRVSRRAAALVLTLFVVAIIFVAGLGFLSRSAADYQAAARAGSATEALAVAEAGLQDALAKLQRDLQFPPPSSNDQAVYAYQDTLENSGGEVVGSYEVVVDRRAFVLSEEILVIRSTGRLGDPTDPKARRTVEIEIDMNRSRATYFQIVSWTDLGGF